MLDNGFLICYTEIKMEVILMPKGKKNSTAKSATTKTTSKSVADPIKEKAAESENKTVKPTAEKKKATAPKKAAATKSTSKTRTTTKASTSATAKAASAKTVAVTETKKAAPKTTKKATTNTVKKSTTAKAKTSANSTAKKAAASNSKNPNAKKTTNGKSDEVLIQSSGKDYTLSEITELCKNDYRGGTRKQVKSIKVYVKAEKNKLKAYYVVNDSVNGSVDL